MSTDMNIYFDNVVSDLCAASDDIMSINARFPLSVNRDVDTIYEVVLTHTVHYTSKQRVQGLTGKHSFESVRLTVIVSTYPEDYNRYTYQWEARVLLGTQYINVLGYSDSATSLPIGWYVA